MDFKLFPRPTKDDRWTIGVYTNPGMKVLTMDLETGWHIELRDALENAGAEMEDDGIFMLSQAYYKTVEEAIAGIDDIVKPHFLARELIEPINIEYITEDE